MVEAVLALNALWFALGFHLFALRGSAFAKLLVADEHRATPVFDTLVRSGKFLGGFNLAFAVLNVLLLLNSNVFDQELQWGILLIANTVAHATQFAYNLPVFLQNQRGLGVWQVKGLMLFIFIIDLVLTVMNGTLAAIYIL